MGVREDPWELRLDRTSVALEQGLGTGFEAGSEGGSRDACTELPEHCRPRPDMSRECLGRGQRCVWGGDVSGNELSCASAQRLV